MSIDKPITDMSAVERKELLGQLGAIVTADESNQEPVSSQDVDPERARRGR